MRGSPKVNKRPDLEPQKDLLRSIRVGDTISINGSIRVVRGVHRNSRHTRICFTFSILHCSWTKKPYTVMNWIGLYHKDVQILRRGGKVLGSELEKKLMKAVWGQEKELHCCDVIGVLR